MAEAMPWDGKFYPKRRPALLMGIAAVTGCAFGLWAEPGPGLQLALAIKGAVLVTLAVVTPLRRRPLAGMVVAAGLAVMFAAWTGWRMAPAPDNLGVIFPEDAELVRVRGTVVEGGSYLRRDPAAFEYPEAPEPQRDFPIGADPRRSETYLVRVDELPDMELAASGYVKLYVPPGTRLDVSSRVEALGKLRKPRRAGNPGEVDSRARYELRGISHVITATEAGQVTVLEPSSSLSPSSLAAGVHDFFHERLGARMPSGRAAVLGATILGERGGLSVGQRADFVKSGTIHLLVVSGMHVALLAAALLVVLRAFGVDPRWAWASAAVLSILYLGVTGLQPSTLRATAMIVIYATGHVLLRRPDAMNALGGSALISALVNPADVAELGFQLSYLAVLGILLVAPALRLFKPRESGPERVSAFRYIARWAGASLRVSLGVALCTAPLLAYSVHIVSPIMVVANLFMGPLVSAILVLAMLCPLAFIPGVDAALAWLLSLLGGVVELSANLFASVPGSHVFLPAPPLWWLVGYYATLALVILLPTWRLPRVSGALVWVLWLCLLPGRALIDSEPPGPATMTALDVGQGQCVVFEVPQGPCVVLDCGSTSLGNAGERVLAPYLWTRGRRHIDTLIISHADADHVNGLPQVLERFAVGEVLIPETLAFDESGRALHQWLEARATVRVLKRGDVLELAPKLRLQCLWPDVPFVQALFNPEGARNDGGLALELQAGGTRALLPSDVEHRGFVGIMPRYRTRGVEVLFAPHQGSAVTGLDSILAALQPKHLLVSAREAFPAPESMELYEAHSQVWRTWDHGAVTFTLGADGTLDVRSHLEP